MPAGLSDQAPDERGAGTVRLLSSSLPLGERQSEGATPETGDRLKRRARRQVTVPFPRVPPLSRPFLSPKATPPAPHGEKGRRGKAAKTVPRALPPPDPDVAQSLCAARLWPPASLLSWAGRCRRRARRRRPAHRHRVGSCLA